MPEVPPSSPVLTPGRSKPRWTAELDKVASVEREIDSVLPVNCGAGGGLLGVEKHCLAGDLCCFSYVAYSELNLQSASYLGCRAATGWLDRLCRLIRYPEELIP